MCLVFGTTSYQRVSVLPLCCKQYCEGIMAKNDLRCHIPSNQGNLHANHKQFGNLLLIRWVGLALLNNKWDVFMGLDFLVLPNCSFNKWVLGSTKGRQGTSVGVWKLVLKHGFKWSLHFFMPGRQGQSGFDWEFAELQECRFLIKFCSKGVKDWLSVYRFIPLHRCAWRLGVRASRNIDSSEACHSQASWGKVWVRLVKMWVI